MAEQGSIQIGQAVRGKYTQDNRVFTVRYTTTWPYTGERVLCGFAVSDELQDHREFEANVERVQ